MTKSTNFFGSQFTGPQLSPGFRLWNLHQEWQRKQNVALSPLELTQPQFSVLAVTAWLERESEQVTQADLCRFAELERMQVSQICRKLEQLGYIDRMPASSDVRATRLRLTNAGERKLLEALPIVELIDMTFFDTKRDLRRALVSKA